MFKWLHGLKGLISEWYVKGEPQAKDRRRLLFSNYNANIIANLIASSFWTGLLLLMHADDTFVGVATMVPFLFNVLQVFSPLLFERFPQRKKLIIIFRFLYYAIQTIFIGLIPLLPIADSGKLSLVMVGLIASNALLALQNPAYSVWITQSLPERVRPAFYSTVNITVNLICSVIPLLGGFFVDRFKAQGMEYEGLMILRIIAMVLAVYDTWLYIHVKEYPYEGAGEKFRIRELFTLPVREKKYRRIILTSFLGTAVAAIPGSFHLLYMLNDVQVSYTFINTVSFFNMLIASVAIAFWKPVLQRWGWLKTFGVGTIFYMVFLIGISFMDKGIEWIYPAFAFLVSATATPTRGLALAGLPYCDLPEKRQSVYLSAYLGLNNLASMAGTYFGVLFIGWVGPRTIELFGIRLVSKQYLCILAGLLCGLVGAAILYSEQKRLKKEQQKEGELS